jgi:hypothetical protein
MFMDFLSTGRGLLAKAFDVRRLELYERLTPFVLSVSGLSLSLLDICACIMRIHGKASALLVPPASSRMGLHGAT